MSKIPLSRLPVGSVGYLKRLDVGEEMQRRLLDIGLVDGTCVQALQKSPLGDPTAYAVRGAVIALREQDTARIWVEV